MRDRVYNYMKAAGKPLPAAMILAEVLQAKFSAPSAADKILAGLVEDDPRFVLSGGLWQITEKTEVFGWPREYAVLSTETSDRENQVRGAVCLSTGMEYAFENDLSIVKAKALLENRILLVWDNKDLLRWNRLLLLNGLPQSNGPGISLSSIAARILNKHAGRCTTDDLASTLEIPAPADCAPTIIARFLCESFPLLLERVPSEFRTDLETLRRWAASDRKQIDFSHFGFEPEFLKQLPESPGVYVMKDRANATIYVGQSRNLKRRVRSYFTGRALELEKIQKIHQQLYAIEIRPTKNEVEALLLEMRLIRKLKPSINLQTEIHPDGQDRDGRNLLLLIGADALGIAAVYFLQDGRFVKKHSARLHRSVPSGLRESIRKVYFVRKRCGKPRDRWETEIVSRWLSRNSRRLNWIDVDEAGSCRNVVGRLNDYFHDPDELRKKVYYR